ncbi:hypothetical protein [Porticoccus sp.]|jgi:uncharacterized membrane protein|uniref:DUF4870 family protein n=1 Tax=Porticoccus sp. TaxID=2024853 RepID=UPI0025F75C1D|nr:hypothetical protein [Porticoccus sp.]|tara:strand:- start:3712 stop:4125 length:414 start_codon:yes stop_codon:yes gene_type:complete
MSDEKVPSRFGHAAQLTGTDGTVKKAVPQVSGQLRDLTQMVYILQIISLVIGLTAVAGIIVNYLKRDEVRGTYLESHFNWQIRTFWWLLAGLVVGWLLTLVLVGFLILGLLYIWYIYRIVRGWLALSDRKGLDDALL